MIQKNTKIICTIGPSVGNEEQIKLLIENGMNVARFNMAHSDYDFIKKMAKIIKKVSKEMKVYVGILVDITGPKIRIGKIKGDSICLKEGDKIEIVKEDIVGDKDKISISYKELDEDILIKSKILLNDGLVELEVEKIKGESVICKVVNGGEISSKKGVNIPGLIISQEFLNEKDKKDIEFAAKIDADFLALSFVSDKNDILDANDLLIGLDNDHISIISKIENLSAINNIDEIIYLSDGIMIARGDLGVEIPPEKLPNIQKELVLKANDNDIFSIVATQMLASMEKCPTATRAEISDVANAILDGADAVMLSGESAIGKYPIKAVEVLTKISASVEKDMDFTVFLDRYDRKKEIDITKLIAHNVVDIANRTESKLIITPTNSGYTAKNVSKFRPCCPIIATSPDEKTIRKLCLNWGVEAMLVDEVKSSDEMIEMSIKIAKNNYSLKKEDKLIITGGSPNKKINTTDFMKIEEI